MSAIFEIIRSIHNDNFPTKVAKSANPLRLGILGAAKIAPKAVILPALSHPDIIVTAVAARSLEKAQAYATKYGLIKAYEGYQTLIDDPDVDVVYNALPNGLHYEWTLKALRAGKHVLNEKPSANTEAETERLFEVAKEKGVVLLDAYHHRFHPAMKAAKTEIEKLGPIKSLDVEVSLYDGFFATDDIRYSYKLGGGALMDLGCYSINTLEYLSSQRIKKVVSATSSAVPNDPKVDSSTNAVYQLDGDLTASLYIDMAHPPVWGIFPHFPRVLVKVACERGEVGFNNFIGPSLMHNITVKEGKKKRTVKDYGNGWSTYRYQLEAFVNEIKAVQAGREVEDAAARKKREDSVSTMRVIDETYKLTMGLRPSSIEKL